MHKPDNVTAVCRSAIQENIMNSILQARCKIQGLYFISFTAVSIMCTECKNVLTSCFHKLRNTKSIRSEWKWNSYWLLWNWKLTRISHSYWMYSKFSDSSWILVDKFLIYNSLACIQKLSIDSLCFANNIYPYQMPQLTFNSNSDQSNIAPLGNF